MVKFARSGQGCELAERLSQSRGSPPNLWDLQGLNLYEITGLLDAFYGVGLESANNRVLVLPFSSLPFYGTAKSLAAYAMVCEALKDGTLGPGRVVVEPTSGNTGLALAEILRGLGIPFIMVVSRKISPAFEGELSRSFGAKTIELEDPTSLEPVLRHIEEHAGEAFTLLVKLPTNYCPTDEPTGAIAYAKRLVKAGGGRIVMLDQYNNEANPKIHREVTAPSILRGVGCLLDHRKLYVFLSGGTFGTALGLAQFFLENRVDAKLVVVLPRGEDVFGVVDLESAKKRRFYRELVALADRRRDLFEIVEVDEPTKKISQVWDFNQKLRKLGGRVDLTGGHSSMLVLWCALNYVREKGLRNSVCVLLFHDSSKMYSEPKPAEKGQLVVGDEDLTVEREDAKRMVLEEGAHILYIYPIPAPIPGEVKAAVKQRLGEILGAHIGDDHIRNIEEVLDVEGLARAGETELKPEFYKQVVEGWGEKPIILVCPHGGTSRIVASKLRKLGIARAYSLKGGLDPTPD